MQNRRSFNYAAFVGIPKQTLEELFRFFLEFIDGACFLPSFFASQLSPNGRGDIAPVAKIGRGAEGAGRERDRERERQRDRGGNDAISPEGTKTRFLARDLHFHPERTEDGRQTIFAYDVPFPRAPISYSVPTKLRPLPLRLRE